MSLTSAELYMLKLGMNVAQNAEMGGFLKECCVHTS